MTGRRLSPEEQAIWSRVAQTVSPLPGRRSLPAVVPVDRAAQAGVAPAPAQSRRKAASPAGVANAPVARPVPAPTPVAMLDDSWERRIATGALIPEMSVDLHGHSLEAAHKRLNQALAAAVGRGVRVLLVVTGNPRPMAAASLGQKTRGAIRAEIGDWLALSGHAEAIASVRTAHPRHGGRGALYIILRRRK